MKILLTSFALLLSFGCDDGVDVSDQKVSLKINEKYSAKGITVRLEDITDSRCPKEATCFWAGAAVVTLVINPSHEHDTLRLCLGACRALQLPFQEMHTDTLTIGRKEYIIALHAVLPYPEQGKEIQPKAAVLSFEELL